MNGIFPPSVLHLIGAILIFNILRYFTLALEGYLVLADGGYDSDQMWKFDSVMFIFVIATLIRTLTGEWCTFITPDFCLLVDLIKFLIDKTYLTLDWLNWPYFWLVKTVLALDWLIWPYSILVKLTWLCASDLSVPYSRPSPEIWLLKGLIFVPFSWS